MSKILMVTSEATPFIKTGGLADVCGALPQALVRQGHEVAVVMPRYQDGQVPWDAERVYHEMEIWIGGRVFGCSVDRVWMDGVNFYFVNCGPLYYREGVYGNFGGEYHDNHIRFGVLCRAALEVVRHIFRPDIIHCHDWPTGLVGPYIRHTFGGDPTFFGIRLVMTIHNLGYQGRFGSWAMGELGLDMSLFRSDLVEYHGDVNFLKAGLVYADHITTVSPRYAFEIQTPEGGFGLDALLRARHESVTGILNGADYREWNPETDHHLPVQYSAADVSGKRACKQSLLAELGLPPYLDRPLIGIVSRFADQKGFELFGQVAGELVHEDCAFAVIGNGDRGIEDLFRYLARERPDKFGVRIGYDNGLAHRVEAGADMFLMPSKYEPCGLSQIYSLRYGTVPIVRAVGGLDDTINESTGFKFQEYSGWAMLGAIREALAAYRQPDRWRALEQAGMRADFSWDVAAAQYADLYQRISLRP
ncbi:MAG: glycogen synthase GlgA [Bryobacteraceae bacterium]